jgi:hypothetical protein
MLKETSWRKSRQHKASGGVFHSPLNASVQDLGSR